MILYLQTLWKTINPIYLMIYSLVPLLCLIIYYAKFGRNNAIRFKQLNNKINKVKDNEDYLHVYEKNNRTILWKEGLHIIFTYFPFIGYGL